MGELYCGDNLEIMKGFNSGIIDLIYMDPPFNSNRDYKEFDDRFKGKTTLDKMNNYLEFMIPRIKECHRLLKNTASFYLHCDPTAGHYLKIELDKIFGIDNFKNEIVWGYRTGGVSKRHYPRKHDLIFFYSKSKKYNYIPLQERIYYEKAFFSDKQDEEGRYYADVYIRDIWEDIKPLINMSSERTDYPTQKPLALLERIIKVSSNLGDLILDPFYGSGTTLEAAEKLGREYIGIDINPKAIEIAKSRLSETIPDIDKSKSEQMALF